MSAAVQLRSAAEGLWPRLEPLLPGLSIEVPERVGSTNTALLERARAGDSAPCLMVAIEQTGGRGRLGRAWIAAPGASLAFSLALPLAPRDWSGLSLAVGIALAEALQPPAGSATPRIALKWPNDLWLIDGDAAQGRKFGGVLIETLAAGARRLAVIGVGINIAPLAVPLAAGLEGRTGCLNEIHPRADAPATLARIALPLVQALKTFEREGFAPFAARFAALDALRDLEVATSDARCPQGIARGVDGQGGLRIETASGPQVLHGGEVSVRPAGHALPLRPAATQRS
jgi:BirA family transcriptional regulator, biotin operon repressor / biotin---[acetyl-CoA-carboxylase] ligase